MYPQSVNTGVKTTPGPWIRASFWTPGPIETDSVYRALIYHLRKRQHKFHKSNPVIVYNEQAELYAVVGRVYYTT